MTCPLMENESVNSLRAAMGSGMECPIGSNATQSETAMNDIYIDIDPDGDISIMKVSEGSWISAINDVKNGSEHIAAALKEKNSLLSKEMNLTICGNFIVCMIRREWQKKQKMFSKKLNQH